MYDSMKIENKHKEADKMAGKEKREVQGHSLRIETLGERQTSQGRAILALCRICGDSSEFCETFDKYPTMYRLASGIKPQWVRLGNPNAHRFVKFVQDRDGDATASNWFRG